MNTILQARGLSKHYGSQQVLQDINLTISQGEIVGLIGPNGAGKTTLLKAILGLAPYDGELDILGLNPKQQRDELMKKVSFIADTATLPQWISIDEAIAFMASVHPQFNTEKARHYLKNTNINGSHKVRQLSKGMVTKAHLSLIMAIDSEVLVLDEPTLGLDIVKRKEFYQQLLGDYFDNDKTIIITTHQVEEIEQLLTRALFIDNGHLILDDTIDNINSLYHSVCVVAEQHEAAEAAGPFHRSRGLKGTHYSYRDKPLSSLTHLGDVHTPSLADLFVAMVTDSAPVGA